MLITQKQSIKTRKSCHEKTKNEIGMKCYRLMLLVGFEEVCDFVLVGGEVREKQTLCDCLDAYWRMKHLKSHMKSFQFGWDCLMDLVFINTNKSHSKSI